MRLRTDHRSTPSAARRTLTLAGIAGLLALPAVAFAGTPPTEIKAGVGVTPVFSPANPPAKTVGEGTTFHWSQGNIPAQSHNVVQKAGLFSSGAPTKAIDYSRNASAGTFPYLCQVHPGMEGTIKATPNIFNVQPTQWTVEWANAATNTGKAFDVRYRVVGGAWKVWKNDTKATQANFGANGKPVTVDPNKTYEFQARSEKSTTKPGVKSGWSPSAFGGAA